MTPKKMFKLPESGLHGKLLLPGDKSISHRALLIGAISNGKTVIKHFLRSDDCLNTLQAIKNLGIFVEQHSTDIIIHGKGLYGLQPASQPLDMGNSGTTTRLIMGLLAGQPFRSKLIGDSSLQKRPMRRVSEPLAAMGAKIQTAPAGTLPVKIDGQPLHGTKIKLQIASAQVKSALILAALQANSPSTIIEKLPTRDHTERMLRKFGADVQTAPDKLTITVQPHPKLEGQTVTVPGDMSSAAFFLVAATIIPNSNITLCNVNINKTRTGILKALLKMGANIKITKLESQEEPVADIQVKYAPLTPIKLSAKDIPAIIDELPLIALLAACANGQSTITGAQELRFKETDRIATVAQELRKLGVQLKELPDGLIIEGQSAWQITDSTLDSHGDHRIGMMMTIAALRSTDDLLLNNPEAVSISYPNFFSDLSSLLKTRTEV
ncbi:3-phosphoshikimate 1-carboxyvinyltransferase [Liquorilactobacillus aquaticus DSM 21051]|uniref:3-phosphoshikimate 1-carboxyvinyltransferase n=1 Tax=Liquorilactobacillus aquaticus DSM 21051 TaxID=1423725 RepID=A0A0R2CY04_9LACO|nr:3-phosphoshikimate 1-carboxyvinyltransferase [Liquorilactobacillus aquaticus]KRM96765.1 3-phosphoshikimate 1-carboxyvinyltransferase [Liquorilactobacillus aquaticus DSM 21051]